MKFKIAAVVWSLVAFFLLRFFLVRRAKCAQRKIIPDKPSRVKLTRKNLRQAREQISDSMSYEFSCLLSHAVKVYIGAACKIPAQHMSSEEIIDKLLSDSANDWSTMGLLAEVLKTTDSGKYAKRKLSAAQQMGIYKKACRFIILSERSLRRAKPNFTAPD